MGIFDWLFGKKEKSMKKVGEVSTKVIAMVEEVFEKTVVAEKAAVEANVEMPEGIGARASHARNLIVEALERSKEQMIKLIAITEEIDIEIKKVVKKTKAITKDSEVDEVEKNIVRILVELSEKIKRVKKVATDAVVVTEEAVRKTKAEVDAKYFGAHAGMGDRLINANLGVFPKEAIEEIKAEQRMIDKAAENAKLMAAGAREARTRVAETVKTVKEAIYPLKELKQSLYGLLRDEEYKIRRQIKMEIFDKLFGKLLNRMSCIPSRKRLDVPTAYDPALHYNCFIETVPDGDRQAVYQELRRTGMIRASHFLPDGRLQLSLLKLSAGLDAINAVAKDKVFAAGLTKARLIELMATNPYMDVTVLEKTNNPHVLHAERILLSQIVVDSDEAFRKGVTYHGKQQYQKAIECYDDAIRIEPDDVRAWHNKIIALAQDGKHQAAIQVADEILGRHPNVGILWEAKGWVLTNMGKLVDAGECMSKACKINPNIAKEHAGRIDQKRDKRFQALMSACRKEGKNPETDVNFWFGKFVEYTNSGDAEGAWVCLQMAATIKPDYFVISDESGMVLLPPGHLLLSKELLPKDVRVERLRDFFGRMKDDSRGKKA